MSEILTEMQNFRYKLVEDAQKNQPELEKQWKKQGQVLFKINYVGTI
jgi:hypothetical protein